MAFETWPDALLRKWSTCPQLSHMSSHWHSECTWLAAPTCNHIRAGSRGHLWGCSWEAGTGNGAKTGVLCPALGEGTVSLGGIRSSWVHGASKRDVLHKPTQLFMRLHVINSNDTKKVKKNISYKYSAEFGLVITELETDITSWTPTVLQTKVYQSPFPLPLLRGRIV